MTNVKSKNALSKMKKDAETQYSLGFWSTSSPEQAIRHELGHAIQHLYTDNNKSKLHEISVLRTQIMDKCNISSWSLDDNKTKMLEAGKYLSYYGLRNEGEFIAESVAEYMNGNSRETAKKVIDILLRGE